MPANSRSCGGLPDHRFPRKTFSKRTCVPTLSERIRPNHARPAAAMADGIRAERRAKSDRAAWASTRSVAGICAFTLFADRFQLCNDFEIFGATGGSLRGNQSIKVNEPKDRTKQCDFQRLIAHGCE